MPTDNDGMLVDELPKLLAEPHKVMYAISHLPESAGHDAGAVTPRSTRAHSGEGAGCRSIEDDPYGELRYSGDKVPSVLQMEAEVRGATNADGNVIYCGTFSKILTPGLRIGWVAAAFPVIDKLVQVKQGADLHTTSALNQVITYEVARRSLPRRAHRPSAGGLPSTPRPDAPDDRTNLPGGSRQLDTPRRRSVPHGDPARASRRNRPA